MTNNEIHNYQLSSDKALSTIRKHLNALGMDIDQLNAYTDNELLEKLAESSESILDLKREYDNLKEELEHIKQQKTALLSSPNLKISGENIDTTLTDYMTSVDGLIYYLDSFLNTFLPDKISYNNGVIQYGSDVPKKVNAVSSGLIYDNSGFNLYNGESHFTMSLINYDSGIVNNNNWESSLTIACDEKYSELSFTLGHVDNSGSSNDKKLAIYYLDLNGKYNEAFSIKLYKDMPVESFIVPIYNTKSVKINASTDSTSTRYGLADIYLIK